MTPKEYFIPYSLVNWTVLTSLDYCKPNVEYRHAIEFSTYEALQNGYNNLMNENDKIKEELRRQNKIMRESIILSAKFYFDRRDGKHNSIGCWTCDMGDSGNSNRPDEHDNNCPTAIAHDTLIKCGSTEPTTKQE